MRLEVRRGRRRIGDERTRVRPSLRRPHDGHARTHAPAGSSGKSASDAGQASRGKGAPSPRPDGPSGVGCLGQLGTSGLMNSRHQPRQRDRNRTASGLATSSADPSPRLVDRVHDHLPACLPAGSGPRSQATLALSAQRGWPRAALREPPALPTPSRKLLAQLLDHLLELLKIKVCQFEQPLDVPLLDPAPRIGLDR